MSLNLKKTALHAFIGAAGAGIATTGLEIAKQFFLNEGYNIMEIGSACLGGVLFGALVLGVGSAAKQSLFSRALD